MADDVIVREEGGALVTEEDGYRIRNLDQAFRLAKSVVDGGMAPKGITEPGAVVAIWKAGSELGIPEMHALSALTFINGRIGIMVEAAMALVRTMGGLEPGTDFRTDFSGEGDEQGYTATAIKRGIHEPCQRRFTVRMAKRARLWGKTGPWQELRRSWQRIPSLKLRLTSFKRPMKGSKAFKPRWYKPAGYHR